MSSLIPKTSHEIEQQMGIEYYCTTSEGIGGQIRTKPRDFKVEEILPDQRIIEIDNENFSLGKDEPGLFTEFILIKENIESHKALLLLSKELNKKINDINVAGTKDKTAITAQRATVWRVNPKELLEVNIPGITIKSPRTTIFQTYLGDLNGNHFTINIRNIQLEKKIIQKRIKSIKKNIEDFGGVGNFFGHQRFGTRRPISHIVGKEIIKGNIKEAVETYISKISSYEHESTIKARKTYKDTNDPEEAYRVFSREMIFERMILKHLMKYPNDYLGGFSLLPKNLQRLFIHSYQSYIWNKVLSKRIEVQKNLQKEKFDILENNEIVFPIIGYKTSIDDNYLFEYMMSILDQDGIKLNDFKVSKLKNLKFSGSYRNMIIHPNNLKVELNTEKKDNIFVRLQFSLSSGSYATVILREFMKSSPLNY